jgi:hypothetical protein
MPTDGSDCNPRNVSSKRKMHANDRIVLMASRGTDQRHGKTRESSSPESRERDSIAIAMKGRC